MILTVDSAKYSATDPPVAQQTYKFNVVINWEPCKIAVFETSPAGLINMSIDLPSTATSS